jgi:hypothetical protein
MTTASTVESDIKTETIRELSSGTAGVGEGSVTANGCAVGAAVGIVDGVAVGTIATCSADIGCGVCNLTEQLYVEVKPALSLNCT